MNRQQALDRIYEVFGRMIPDDAIVVERHWTEDRVGAAFEHDSWGGPGAEWWYACTVDGKPERAKTWVGRDPKKAKDWIRSA